MDRIWLRAAPGETVESLAVSRSITEWQVRRFLIGAIELVALAFFVAFICGGVLMVAIIAGAA